MKKLISLICVFMLTGCTLSFSNACVMGTGSDVIDSDPRNDVTADPNLNIPMSAVPGL